MKQPPDRDADYPQYYLRSPVRPIVTWMNAELRERLQRNGAALAEIHLAMDTQRAVQAADQELEDRELEDREAEP